MQIQCHRFQERCSEALLDENLQKALAGIKATLASRRNEAFAALADAEELRERAHRIKCATFSSLDEHLQRLEREVTQQGGRVHWAETAGEAREIIENLALRNKVRTVVKGKSMTSEEIGLNEGLAGRGLDVFETDLGEFIIQLAGEPPSHIVGPAIHKTKEQVSRLFSEKLNVERLDDPREMTMLARRVLRRRFLDADMGITGANFAVADTGGIVLFENEGNIRLTTSLPRIHVALMGIEKVIPGLDDLHVMMQLLARSCTGQKLPTYVSMIHGPKGPRDRDGAEQFHLVILDNGRSRILADDDLSETLFCIRCGACLNICPVYLHVGGHAYGWVYSGPIGAILTPQLLRGKTTSQLPYASTLCGACAEVCPVKIDIPAILVALRQRYAENPAWPGTASSFERAVFAFFGRLLQHREAYERAARFAGWLQSPVARLLAVAGRRVSSGILEAVRNAPPLARRSFYREWKSGNRRTRRRRL